MPETAPSTTTEILKDVFGRGMSTQSDVYMLPTDAEEHARLTLQHRIWKLMFGGPGLYPPEVDVFVQRLLPRSDSNTASEDNSNETPPAVLDLGSGSGIWSAEMAAMYPHAKVVGLDLSEPKLQRSLIPSNCSFVTADLTKGLDKYEGYIDIVHCRCVAGHVKDRQQLLHEIAKVLKPGGLLLLSDGNLHLYRLDGSRVSPASPQKDESQGSWLSYWFEQTIGRFLSTTLEPEYAGGEYVGWHIGRESQLKYIGEKEYWSPVILKRQSIDEGVAVRREEQGRRNEGELARLMNWNIDNYLTASRPILLSAGISEEMVEDWLTRARAEVRDPDPEETWLVKWNMAWATKVISD